MNTRKIGDKTQVLQTIHTTVNGHQVVLKFADKPNLDVADQVKQALLNAYCSTRK